MSEKPPLCLKPAHEYRIPAREFDKRTREVADRIRAEHEARVLPILASYPRTDDLPLSEPMRLRRETR